MQHCGKFSRSAIADAEREWPEKAPGRLFLCQSVLHRQLRFD